MKEKGNIGINILIVILVLLIITAGVLLFIKIMEGQTIITT